MNGPAWAISRALERAWVCFGCVLVVFGCVLVAMLGPRGKEMNGSCLGQPFGYPFESKVNLLVPLWIQKSAFWIPF